MVRRWQVRDVMTEDVVSISERTPFKDIVQTLSRHSISAVPVIDDERRVAGVVSEADVLHKMEFTGGEPHLPLLERKRRRDTRVKAQAEIARDLMTAPAVVIDPDATITFAARLMDEERIKRLPVVNGFGQLVGIVSRTDLLRVYLRDDESIRAEIVDRVLTRALWFEPGTVTVTVRRGVVNLTGTVDRRTTIGIVVRLASSVAGVVEVVDNLTYHYDDRHQAVATPPSSA